MIGGAIFLLCVAYLAWLTLLYPRVIRGQAAGRTLPELPDLPDITVIVPAFNEERNIAAKMDDLEKQDYPRGRMIVFVVDNGSTDRTAEIARMCNAVVLNSRRGKIAAINAACAQSEADIVVVTDADTTLDSDALRVLVQPLADPLIAAVGGRVKVDSTPTWWSESKLAYHELDWELRVAEGLVDTPVSLDGKLMAWRLSALAGLPQKAAVDDLVLPLILRRMGYRSVIAPGAIVHEAGETTWQGELRQIRRRAAISMPPIGEYMGLMFAPNAGWHGHVIFPTRRVLAIFAPFMLLFCWLYVFAISWPVWLLCTVAGGVGIVWKRAYFPLLQQAGILLAWTDFLRGRVAPAAAWSRNE